jgi:hypothetical protein
VLSASSLLNDDILKLGLKHRNRTVRLDALMKLIERKILSPEESSEIKEDSSALMRKTLVDFLLSNGQEVLDDEAVKKILVKPKSNSGFGLGGGLSQNQTDIEGQSYYEDYLFTKYISMTERELLTLTKKHNIFNVIPYYALCSRYFKSSSEELRSNIKDKFKRYSETYIKEQEARGFPEDLIKQTRDLGEVLRKQFTRRGLDILCEKGEARDLTVIRNNMRSGFTKSSLAEIDYMYQYGEWEDIPFILKAENDYSTQSILSISRPRDAWYDSVVRTVYKIGRVRLKELFKVEMPHYILVELITISSAAKFSELSDEVLFDLLNREDDSVRKAASLKSIQSFKKSKLKSILRNYVEGVEYRYYNVIYWLDFGISVSRTITTRAVNLISINR